MSLDLDIIELPDLGGDDFPEVEHEPTCVVEAVGPRDCWPPELDAIYAVRPYAHPDAELGCLRVKWMRIRNLFPVPPSVGIHCSSLISSQFEVELGHDIDLNWEREIGEDVDDACLPDLLDRISIPCPTITSGSASVNVSPGATPSWNREINASSAPGNPCVFEISDNLNIPCFLPSFSNGLVYMADEGGGGFSAVGSVLPRVVAQSGCNLNMAFDITLPFFLSDIDIGDIGSVDINVDATLGRFRACETVSHNWDGGYACVTDVFEEGEEIPVVLDLNDSFGGLSIGSGGDMPDTSAINGGPVPIACGDRLKLVKIDESVSPTQYFFVRDP